MLPETSIETLKRQKFTFSEGECGREKEGKQQRKQLSFPADDDLYNMKIISLQMKHV